METEFKVRVRENLDKAAELRARFLKAGRHLNRSRFAWVANRLCPGHDFTRCSKGLVADYFVQSVSQGSVYDRVFDEVRVSRIEAALRAALSVEDERLAMRQWRESGIKPAVLS